MDKVEINKFVDKAIAKTLNHDLLWKSLTKNDIVKPLPTDNLSVVGSLTVGHLSVENSYISHFSTGTILLLVFPSLSSLPLFSPPDGCVLSLRIQDEKSRYSVEIANTSSDKCNAPELIRLYNLIDKQSSSLNTLIDDFLNS